MKKIIIVLILFLITSCSSLQFDSFSIESKKYQSEKKVIFTADDFGISKNINEGIIDGVQKGVINHVDAMVTFDGAIDEIIKLQEMFPNLEIGLHLSITSGKSVSNKENIKSLVNKKDLFYSIDQIIPVLDKIDLKELKFELRSQINMMIENNIKITSISSQHNILSLYSPFFDIILELSKEYNIPLRSTVPFSIAFKKFNYAKTSDRGKDLAIDAIKNNIFLSAKRIKYFKYDEMLKNQNKMKLLDINHPDYLCDVFWGDPTPANLFNILSNLPDGISEIVFHLGLYEDEEKNQPGIDKNYYLMREFELMVVTSPQIERWLKCLNIQVVGYRDL